MRNMCLGITAFVVTVGMVSVGAQGRNFSGTWVVDSEKTMAAAQAAMTESAGAARTGGGAGGRGMGTGGTITAAGVGGAVSGVPVVAGSGERTGGGGGGRARGTGTGEVAAAGGVGAGGGAVRAVAVGGGGRGGGGGLAAETVITMDASTFTVTQGDFQTSYPLNGAETVVQLRGGTAKATAAWKGDMLVIEQTMDTPNGPSTSTTSWFLEGDSLVRLTTRRTYFKKK